MVQSSSPDEPRCAEVSGGCGEALPLLLLVTLCSNASPAGLRCVVTASLPVRRVSPCADLQALVHSGRLRLTGDECQSFTHLQAACAPVWSVGGDGRIGFSLMLASSMSFISAPRIPQIRLSIASVSLLPVVLYTVVLSFLHASVAHSFYSAQELISLRATHYKCRLRACVRVPVCASVCT